MQQRDSAIRQRDVFPALGDCAAASAVCNVSPDAIIFHLDSPPAHSCPPFPSHPAPCGLPSLVAGEAPSKITTLLPTPQTTPLPHRTLPPRYDALDLSPLSHRHLSLSPGGYCGWFSRGQRRAELVYLAAAHQIASPFPSITTLFCLRPALLAAADPLLGPRCEPFT